MLEVVFKSILQMSLSASVIAIIVLILRLFFSNKSPKILFLCLWAVVFYKFLIPFEIQSHISLYNQVNANQITAITSQQQISDQNNENIIIPLTQDSQQTIKQNTDNNINITNNSQINKPKFSIISTFSIIWLCGSLLLFFIFIILFIMTQRRFRHIEYVQNNWINKFISKHKTFQKIRIGVLPGISSPIMIGIFKPIIIFPTSFDLNNIEYLQYILAHEINHIKRFDNLWNIFALFAVCLHWFNPFSWISYRMLTKDVEITCDESVIRKFKEAEKVNYANVILNVASNSRKQTTSFVMGFGQTSIRERVTSIMKYKKIKFISIIVAVIVCISISAIFGTSAIKKNANDSKEADNKAAINLMSSIDSCSDTSSSNNLNDFSAVSSSQFTSSKNNIAVPESIKIIGTWNGHVLSDGDCFTGTAQLSVVFVPENVQNKSVTWSSSNDASISVDQNGVITEGSGETVEITATTWNGKTAKFKIGVFGTGCIPDVFPKSVSIDGKSEDGHILVDLGTHQLTTHILPDNTTINIYYKWTSSDPSSVSVDKNGVITALKAGSEALITVYAIPGGGDLENVDLNHVFNVTDHVYVNVNP